MYKEKIVGLALCGLISTGAVLPSLQTKVAYASESSNITQNDSTSNESDLGDSNLIKQIENEYLKQNNDGTFYLLNDIYKTIDAESVATLKSSMEQINSLILSDKLEFKIETVGENKKVINTKNSVVLENDATPKTRGIFDSFSTVLSSSKYSGGHQYYWWGFTANINKIGASIMQADFAKYAAIYGGGSLLLKFIPGGAALAKAAGVGVGITFASAIAECSKGVSSGLGVRVTSLGKPQFGQIVKVAARL